MSIHHLRPEPEGLLAVGLATLASENGGAILVARSETRAARLYRSVRALAPDLACLLLPAWDTLPYDRAAPSAGVMGRRVAIAARLARRPDCVLIASIDAVLQRLPPPDLYRELRLAPGDAVDPAALTEELLALGYTFDDQVDAPGEAAVRGEVIDVYPPAFHPCRIEHEEGRVTGIRRFDPGTQRGRGDEAAVPIGRASEFPPSEDQASVARIALFDLMPHAALVLDPEVAGLRTQRAEEIAEAFRARLALPAPPGEPAPLPPAALYVEEADWEAACAGREVLALPEPEEEVEGVLPAFRTERDPERALIRFLEAELAAGQRAGLSLPPGDPLVRRVRGALQQEIPPLPDWRALAASPPGTLALLPAGLSAGFVAATGIALAAGDIRAPRPARSLGPALLRSAAGEATMQPGDAVIHADHGVAAMRGIETVEVDGLRSDRLRLEYAGGTTLLVPVDELDRLWRYGAEAEEVGLDHLNTDSWARRRAEVQAAIDATAGALVELARARDAATAPVIRPPRARAERFASRFLFEPTTDQQTAIDAALADLASGRPMDRLVCGDVGYGKTEVALRAAAAAALAGFQVAVLAPTTVLVRQHLANFTRRFAGLGLRIAGLSRLSSAAEARATKAGLADGSVAVAIGTQALAARDVRFARLGLVVIDEEQRFGRKQKDMLRQLSASAHVLTLTATPIPRTLQSALVGLQDLSVIATPPVRRRPVQTVAAELDPLLVRNALARERSRGGQSFVVCPRIEDLAGVRARLAEWLPELSVMEAHGRMTPAEMDEAVLRFADGEGDVLLATNIVETGLDVPRANTMLIWGADRFGLAQLHQLRGRVGRSATRGFVYLLTLPERPPTRAAAKRLRILETLDRLGAGFAISARDMDLRGAGDLLGEAQAGHMKLIGLDLYQHLLDRALHTARGEAPQEEWAPTVSLAVPALIPEEYVPEPDLRIGLYVRLGRMMRDAEDGDLDAFREEMEDRFGKLPPEVEGLFGLAHLRIACREQDVAALEVGPAAAAARLRSGPPRRAAAPLALRGDRLILARATATAAERVALAEELLQRIGAAATVAAKAA